MAGKGDAGIYIMVIGETGTGKSTFINTTVNFFRGGSIERGGHDLKIAIPTKFFKATEQEGRKATELDVKQGRVSQTQECTPYLFNYKGRSVTVIDSPGLNDTRGLEQDEKNLAHILKTIEALPHLNALIVTTNGTLERLGVAARNVLSKLRGSIPDVILEHVLIISTNCDPLTANFKVDTLRTDLPGVKIAKDTCYTMQNAAFSSDPRKWADPEHKAAFERLASCWKDSMATLEAIMVKVTGMSPQSTGAFKELREKRDAIKAKMSSALIELRNMQALEDKLERSQYDLEGALSNQETYKDFCQTSTVEDVQQVNCSYHNTLCQTCQQVCHEHCGLEFEKEAGSDTFRRCACMSGGTECTVCPGRCEAASHFHGTYKIVRCQKTVEKIMEDIKAKYDAASDDLENARSEVGTVKGALDMLRRAQQGKMREIKDLCTDVKRIVTSFNFVDELRSVLDSLEMEKAQMTSNKARDEAEATIQDLRNFIDGLCKDLPAAAPRALERKDSGSKSRMYSRAEFPTGGVRASGQSSFVLRSATDRAREDAEASRREALLLSTQQQRSSADLKAPSNGASQQWAPGGNSKPAAGASGQPSGLIPGQVLVQRPTASADSYMSRQEMDAVLAKVVGEFEYPKAVVEAVLERLVAKKKRVVTIEEVIDALCTN